VKLAVASVVTVLAALAAVARADEDAPEQVRMNFVERGDDLTVSTKLTKLFDNSTYAALDTGFLSTVVIRFWVYPKDSNEPVSFLLVQRSVLYEVWDEDYVLRLDEPGGPKTIKVKYRAEALKLLTSIDDLPIAQLSQVPRDGSMYMLAMEVELNPVSKETLAEVRRWLSQGTGGGLDRGGAFFGSFVSVFVNPKIAAADRVLRIRSQPFFRPKP
jgi:hypothetical protein